MFSCHGSTAFPGLPMILKEGSRPIPNHPGYQLVHKLGAGAFGEVWRTRAPGGMEVALKFIPFHSPEHADTELRSVEVMRSIRHPNLVSVFGAWCVDGCLVLAMELCDRTLADRLKESQSQKLPGIPPDELLGYMRDAAAGLDALCARHVQHRDVKPANLLLLGSGVKVGDFGLAKVREHSAGNTIAGTFAYLAPECYEGTLAAQTDQYSLAVTYFQLRTGHQLFKGSEAEVMRAKLMLEPNLLPLLPAERTVLTRALSKKPSDRWPTCTAFVNALVEVARQLAGAQLSIERINSLIGSGIGKFVQEQYAEAAQDFTIAISAIQGDLKLWLDPQFIRAYMARGNSWMWLGEYDKAVEDFTDCIRLDPKNEYYFFRRGDAHRAKNRFDKAIEDYDESIRLASTSCSSFSARGVAWFALKNYERAIDNFHDAILIDPPEAREIIEAELASSAMTHRERDLLRACFEDAERLFQAEATERRFYERVLGAAYIELPVETLQELLASLTHREREIIKLRYGMGDGYCYTLEEVGRIFKLSAEQVQVVEARAIRRLHACAESL